MNRILIFTGDGKGKTTAALGMAFRAAGHGIRTLVIQFVKSDSSTGECQCQKTTPLIEIESLGKGFLPPDESPDFQVHRKAARLALHRAEEALASRRYGLVILDEICYAVHRTLIHEDEVLALITKAAPDCVLVLTGRGATPGLMSAADTVTEMRCVRHGMDKGIPAQKGVEY